ncbi:DUF4190 domain-containing protein [Microbacterium sp. ET2]|uniref:DUF4190 domain-containing protein n=1 Tax=Microbacterium albipurpureum TaxID=3050384 RepID=UPI00259CD9C3|nr:DUF4190 domain-containing protein [Microbacterium sp. ET2 (Ac-2212)]WJL95474.1 DUF4190 domain-containing protein [Microbacterium sp. ET2 (Ac-2212)]
MSTPDNPQGTDPATPSVPPYPGTPEGSPAPAQPPAPGQSAAYGQQPTPGAYPGQAPYGSTAPYGSAAPYGASSPYGAAPYGAYAAPKTNVLAIVSLISSIASFVVLPFIGSLVGVITGHMGLSQIKRTGEQGRGLALAGTIVGYVGLGFILLLVLFFLSFLPLIIGSATTGTLS